ncbi:MAG: alpha/beta hydrolase [Candidatus Aminicenantes bacterium]|jgi:pimeloyl-ACP methyl ester carboxylesterase/TM2 domain-containing membrane protein YozV
MGKTKKEKTQVKKRSPVLSALLSLISLGLGQVYNGELRKGILLKVTFLLTICLYAFLSFKVTHDLLLLLFLVGVFVLLKVYSIVQAIFKSRKLGISYTLRRYNKSYFYIVLTVVFLLLSVILPIKISNLALMDMSANHPFRSAKAKEMYLESYDRMEKLWLVVSEARTVETSYGRTFVRISGPVDGLPLVLLPGANATSLMWFPNIEALSNSYRTYAVDNIYDFGRSVFTRRIKTSDDYVAWLDELFDVLALGEKINLMGLSYGGWLTSQYAIRYPDRLKKIVLLAPAATILPLRPEFLKNATLSLIPHRHYVKKTMFVVLEDLVNKNQKGRELAEELVDQMYLAQRCFKPKMLPGPTVLSDEELENLKLPTLYLVGENEKIYSPEEAIERLSRIAPEIEAKIIPGTGHDLSVVQAEMVNQIIIDFLNACEGS